MSEFTLAKNLINDKPAIKSLLKKEIIINIEVFMQVKRRKVIQRRKSQSKVQKLNKPS